MTRTLIEVGGGGADPKVIEQLDAEVFSDSTTLDLVAVDLVVSRLSDLDPRMAEIVELRIFAGVTVRDISCVLDVSKRTVDSEWSVAKKWLRRELRGLTA